MVDESVEAFVENVMAQYQRETQAEPAVYVTEATGGASRLEK